MKASVSTTFTISDETTPTDIRFSSGTKTFADATNFAESESSTFSLAASEVSYHTLPLGSMSLISLLYLFTKTAGVKVKLTPEGGDPADAIEMELIPNCPAIIPMKLMDVKVTNTGGSATSIVYAAAGN